jgi:hypothetical protein
MKLTYLLALIPSLALATGKPETPKPAPTTVPIAVSGSQSAAGADADARAAALAGARSDATGGAANATGGTGNGSVEVGGDVSDFDAKALALGQIRAYAAPAVPGECRIHTAGWDVTVFSKTGATRFERECREEQKCFRIVEVYLRMGREAAALKQLGVCGGLLDVPVDAAPEPAKADMSAYATKEELNRAFERSVSK